MAASKITYSDKVGITPKETHINQVWDADLNAIKTAINIETAILSMLIGVLLSS